MPPGKKYKKVEVFKWLEKKCKISPIQNASKKLPVVFGTVKQTILLRNFLCQNMKASISECQKNTSYEK